jgi:hypothetical protein
MTMKGKFLREQQLLGSRGIALIAECVSEMGLVWRATSEHDVGIDGEIEIRDTRTRKMSGLLIKVQSKAVTDFKNETSEFFDYWPEQRDVDYWLSVNLPVILVVSRPETREAYWLPVKEYVQSNPGEKRFRFSKVENCLALRSLGKLVDLAKSGTVGIYSPPLAKKERLICNLLPVSRLPERLYLASTDYRDRKKLFTDVRDSGGEIHGDFILKDKQILSIRDLSDPIYGKLCDQGTIEDFGVEEWADSEDPRKLRDFVQLLNFCLREKLTPYNLRFDKDTQCYFFRASDNLESYKIGYQATERFADREVFKVWRKYKDGSITCWRHSAMKAQYYRYEYKWYLEVTPTYFFTSNGFRQHKQHGEFLTEIKMEERNNAVHGQFIMWAGILTDTGDMLRLDYPYLQFGKPLAFETDIGIEDSAWKSRDQASKTEICDTLLFELL